MGDLRRIQAEEAIFQEVDLQGGSLKEANLKRAQLQDARLAGTDLTGAKLQGADLLDATGLTLDQIKVAEVDEKTRLPGYLRE